MAVVVFLPYFSKVSFDFGKVYNGKVI